jgi:hypothetical protein
MRLHQQARVAAGAFGFLTLIQVFDGPERQGASSFLKQFPPALSGLFRQVSVGVPASLLIAESRCPGRAQAYCRPVPCADGRVHRSWQGIGG